MARLHEYQGKALLANHGLTVPRGAAASTPEQAADVVLFIYRDEAYNPESDQRGVAELIVAKHRNGPTGVARLAFLDHFVKFANMARE